jgi:hypothetical protein
MQWFGTSESVTTDPATIQAAVYTKSQTSVTGTLQLTEESLGLWYGIEIINGAGVVQRRAIGGDGLPGFGEKVVTITGLNPGTAYTVRNYESDAALAAV